MPLESCRTMATETKNLDQDLNSLRIDRNRRREPEKTAKWATRWIIAGVVLFVLLGAAATVFRLTSQATEVETYRVTAKARRKTSSPNYTSGVGTVGAAA